MSGNRVDDDRSLLDELLIDELGEDEVAALLGGGGPDELHGSPTPGYGGHFSSADGMVEKPVVPKVTDENWRVIGDKVVFDRSASDKQGSETMRLIKPEEVPGAKTHGEHVPLSRRNIAASRKGVPGMWIVPEKQACDEVDVDFAGQVFVKEEE